VERTRLKRPLRQDRLVPGKKTRAMPASAQPSALRHSALSAVFPHETATRLPRRTPPNLSLRWRSSPGLESTLVSDPSPGAATPRRWSPMPSVAVRRLGERPSPSAVCRLPTPVKDTRSVRAPAHLSRVSRVTRTIPVSLPTRPDDEQTMAREGALAVRALARWQSQPVAPHRHIPKPTWHYSCTARYCCSLLIGVA
jgi:hypothetical protein